MKARKWRHSCSEAFVYTLHSLRQILYFGAVSYYFWLVKILEKQNGAILKCGKNLQNHQIYPYFKMNIVMLAEGFPKFPSPTKNGAFQSMVAVSGAFQYISKVLLRLFALPRP